jgi:group I intron endonuclease
MFIYKITNSKNGKMYIGQTIGTVQGRWRRHQNDALSNALDTHFARAIRKYRPESFIVETIDMAKTQEELTQKEKYWIDYYDSVNNGYNETNATCKCGGNTYQSKTEAELAVIGEKIRQAKKGGKNPNATKVKCRNVKTGEEHFFDSQAEMQTFFNATNHLFISRRCLGEIKALYKGEWEIAYADKEYGAAANEKHEAKPANKPKAIKVTDLETNEEKSFSSYANAERYFGQKPRAFSSKAYRRGNEFVYKDKFKIEKIF